MPHFKPNDIISLNDDESLWHVGIRSSKLHVDAVGKIACDPRNTTSIFLQKPTGGTLSDPVQNIKISSKLHVLSPAVIVIYFRQ